MHFNVCISDSNAPENPNNCVKMSFSNKAGGREEGGGAFTVSKKKMVQTKGNGDMTVNQLVSTGLEPLKWTNLSLAE